MARHSDSMPQVVFRCFQHCESFTTELCDTEVFYYDEVARRKSLPKHGGGREEDMISECPTEARSFAGMLL